jgi:hypothetical protein
VREGARQRKVPKVGEGVRAVRVWWLARERIGQDLRERYAVAQELPPRLLALVKELDDVEGDRS